MKLTKSCLQCDSEFLKPPTRSKRNWEKSKFCSRKCKQTAQVGQPSPLKGTKTGKFYVKHFLPCRICGEPTKYSGTTRNKLYGMVHCGNPECADKSRQLKNERISEKAVDMYASGERVAVKDGWRNVKRISPEEELIFPWITAIGFVPQYKFLTGVHTNKLPRMFRLDFALPEHKLYIEIDGTVHRLKKKADTRRDSMMLERGWNGIRIPSSDVNNDIESVKERINLFIADITIPSR